MDKEERCICFVDDNISSGTQAVAIFEELLGRRAESIHVKSSRFLRRR